MATNASVDLAHLPNPTDSALVGHARREYVRWLSIAKDLSPHTIRAYDGDVAAFERHLGRLATAAAIDQATVLGFVEMLRAEGLSVRSIRRRLSGVRGFCRWLVSQGVLVADPTAEIPVLAGRARTLPRVVPHHELDRLLCALRSNAGVKRDVDSGTVLRRPGACTTLLAVSLLIATGARVHEIVGLACRDVDVPGRGLRITGKGRRQRQVFLTNDWIAGLTEAYLTARSTLELTHPYVLFSSNGGPLTPSALRLRLSQAAEDAGLHVRITPHMLRHTAATQLIEAGVDIRFVQRLLGHASLTTTEIYTHVSDMALSRVVSDADVLGRLLVDN